MPGEGLLASTENCRLSVREKIEFMQRINSFAEVVDALVGSLRVLPSQSA